LIVAVAPVPERGFEYDGWSHFPVRATKVQKLLNYCNANLRADVRLITLGNQATGLS
jgi:hypothetical protein